MFWTPAIHQCPQLLSKSFGGTVQYVLRNTNALYSKDVASEEQTVCLKLQQEMTTKDSKMLSVDDNLSLKHKLTTCSHMRCHHAT
jgi:hypothetical protein